MKMTEFIGFDWGVGQSKSVAARWRLDEDGVPTLVEIVDLDEATVERLRDNDAPTDFIIELD
jgi:hypothetical protein